MGCRKGATGLCVIEEPEKEKEKRQEDFTVKIVFSPMSYTTYTNWMKMRLGDKSKPHTSSAPVELEVWPRSDAYEAERDELIFIDCSSQKTKNMLPDTDDFKALAVKLSWAINRLKELMYRRTKQGISGTVKCCIMGITPCEMLSFALSRLLGNATEHDDKFAPFICYVLSRPEFRYAFQWIQEYGWMFEVDYCGVFEPHKSILNDFQGSTNRAGEMQKLLTKTSREKHNLAEGMTAGYTSSYVPQSYESYENTWISQNDKERRRNPDTGKIEVMYNGHWTDYDKLELAYEDLVNPSEEQLNESLKQAKKNRNRINNSKNILSSQIDREKAKRVDGTWDEIIENDASRLSRPINEAEGNNYGSGDIKDRLIKEGLVPLQEHYELELKADFVPIGPYLEPVFWEGAGQRYDKKLIFIQGQWMTSEQAAALESKMQEDLDAADKNIQDINKALLAKKYFIVGLVLDAIQFVNGIASIFCPALAFLDIAIQAFRWEFDPTCEVDAWGVAGMVCDVASLVPYFGTIYRTLKAGSKLAAGATNASGAFLKVSDNIADVADQGVDLLNTGNKLQKIGDTSVEITTDTKNLAGAADDSSSMVKVVDDNPNAIMDYTINGEVAGNVGESSRLLTSDASGSSMLADGATDAAKTGSKGANAADDIAEEIVSAAPPFEGKIVGVGDNKSAANTMDWNTSGKHQRNDKIADRLGSHNDDDMIWVKVRNGNEETVIKMKAGDAKAAWKNQGKKTAKNTNQPEPAKQAEPVKQPETPTPEKPETPAPETPAPEAPAPEAPEPTKTPAQQTETVQSNTNSSHSQQPEAPSSSNQKPEASNQKSEASNQNSEASSQKTEAETASNNSGEGGSMTTNRDISTEAVQGQIDATGATVEAAGGNPSNKSLHINRFNEFCSEFKDRWKFYFSNEASLTNMKNNHLFASKPSEVWKGFMSGWGKEAHWEQRLGTFATIGSGIVIGFNGFGLAMKFAGQGKPDENPDKLTIKGEVEEYKPKPVSIDFHSEADKAEQDIERAKQMQKSKDPAEVEAGRQLEKNAIRRKKMAEDGISAKKDEEIYHTYRPKDEDVEASKQKMLQAQNEERAAKANYEKWSTTTPQAELDNNNFNNLQEKQQLELMAMQDRMNPGQTQRDAKANLDSKSSNARDAEQEYLDQKYLQYADRVAQATSQSKAIELANEIFYQQHQNDNTNNNQK